jgi:acetoin utilization protein AcuB
MTDMSIRRLPVMDHDRIAGISTLGDIRGAEPFQASSLIVWEMNDLLAKLKVSEILSHTPATIQQDAGIGEAAPMMVGKKIQRFARLRSIRLCSPLKLRRADG